MDGPSLVQLNRRDIERGFLQAGDIIEVCGFATNRGAASQRAFPEADESSLESFSPNVSGQLMKGHLLVMPDGQKRFWTDYGQLDKCVSPDERDALIR